MIVDLGSGRSLIAATHDVEGTDYPRNKEVLEQMVGSLELPSS